MSVIESGTVLVVDDDPSVLDAVVRILAPLGYQLLQAASGEEALDLARKRNEKIDLLLTDVVMQGINGMELANMLTSISPGIRVLFMSGYICPSGGHLNVPYSEKAFVQKPFLPNTLIKKMRSLLNS